MHEHTTMDCNLIIIITIDFCSIIKWTVPQVSFISNAMHIGHMQEISSNSKAITNIQYKYFIYTA